jgi:hypothetical protein
MRPSNPWVSSISRLQNRALDGRACSTAVGVVTATACFFFLLKKRLWPLDAIRVMGEKACWWWQ